MIDIIIPTLMIIDTTPLNYSLRQIFASTYVNKVIIIDNSGVGNFQKKMDLKNDKLEVHELSYNIYVNPAWNLGVLQCDSDNILIMNDDIFCSKHVLKQISEVMSDEDIGICSVDTFNCSTAEEYTANVTESPKVEINNTFGNKDGNKTGWFFCVKRKYWKPLPEDMKLWYGDDLIYSRIRRMGYTTKNITSTQIGHLFSATLNSMPDFHDIIRTDGLLYKIKYMNKF